MQGGTNHNITKFHISDQLLTITLHYLLITVIVHRSEWRMPLGMSVLFQEVNARHPGLCYFSLVSFQGKKTYLIVIFFFF